MSSMTPDEALFKIVKSIDYNLYNEYGDDLVEHDFYDECIAIITQQRQQAVAEMQAENERLKAENERLRQLTEWQPIETAPKDQVVFGYGYGDFYSYPIWWDYPNGWVTTPIGDRPYKVSPIKWLPFPPVNKISTGGLPLPQPLEVTA